MPAVSANTLALQKSVGFIPQGYDQLPREVYRNLFFSTSNGDSYRPLNQRAGAMILMNCRSKSVQEIHDPAHGMKYKRPEAPLWQRSMCEYSQQFNPLPLDGAGVNKALYNLNKAKQEDCSNKPPAGTKIQKVTTARASYPSISPEAAMKAIPESFKPGQATHIDPTQKLLVTTSTEQRAFRAPTAKQVTSARPESYKPKHDVHTSIQPFQGTSSYERDYYASKYQESWPVRFSQQSRPPPPANGYTGIVKTPTVVDEESQVLKKFHVGDMLIHGIV